MLVLETHKEPPFLLVSIIFLFQSCWKTEISSVVWSSLTNLPKNSRATYRQVQACGCTLTYFLCTWLAWGLEATCSTPLQSSNIKTVYIRFSRPYERSVSVAHTLIYCVFLHMGKKEMPPAVFKYISNGVTGGKTSLPFFMHYLCGMCFSFPFF